MQQTFLSFHGKYEAATAVPVLFITLFLMFYKMVVSNSLYLFVALGNINPDLIYAFTLGN